MNTVKFVIPDDGSQSNGGEVVEVPASDAAHFEAKGWEKEGSAKSDKKKPKSNTAE